MVGIIGAMEIEIAGLAAKMTVKRTETVGTLSALIGSLDGKEIAVCRCGIGKVNAAAATVFLLERLPKMELMINLGVAGGIRPGIRQGDIVVAESVVQHDYDLTPDGLSMGQVAGFDNRNFACDTAAQARMQDVLSKLGFRYTSGIIASGDQFIHSQEHSMKIHREFDASACDMESGAVAQVCALYSVPFLGVRSISDHANGDAVGDFYSFVQKAAERSIRAVQKFLA